MLSANTWPTTDVFTIIILVIILIKEFQIDANRLPRRLQGRCHVNCGVHSVAFSDVRNRTIVGTVPSSAPCGTGVETVKTLSTVVDCFKPLQRRRGRPGHRWCCASPRELWLSVIAVIIRCYLITTALVMLYQTISLVTETVDSSQLWLLGMEYPTLVIIQLLD